MTRQQLDQRLRDDGLVRLEAPEWESLADSYEVLESHDTCFAGDLLIVRGPAGVAAVEQPETDKRLVRRLPDDPDKVRAFVRERMKTYDRMWDGCGCKVDYYADVHAA